MLLAIAATLMLALAFTADVDAAKGGNPGKPPDDPTPPPALTNPAFPFVAEDDTRPRPYRQLCLTNSDGSITEQLTFDIYQESIPEWSPDGTRIAYARA